MTGITASTITSTASQPRLRLRLRLGQGLGSGNRYWVVNAGKPRWKHPDSSRLAEQGPASGVAVIMLAPVTARLHANDIIFMVLERSGLFAAPRRRRDSAADKSGRLSGNPPTPDNPPMKSCSNDLGNCRPMIGAEIPGRHLSGARPVQENWHGGCPARRDFRR
ncbi:MAG: hypothetical protein H7268_15320 [Sandarakinorhabdus sp.]|nr:hypothetical protein [Sandarakinorhabdus sp.]